MNPSLTYVALTARVCGYANGRNLNALGIEKFGRKYRGTKLLVFISRGGKNSGD